MAVAWCCVPWLACRLRDADVWARVDATGAFVLDDGRVEIVYQLRDNAKRYRAGASNLVRGTTIEPDSKVAAPTADTTTDTTPPTTTTPTAATGVAGTPIAVWTDGACTGNPGPCGAGVVYLDGDTRRELSEFLGAGTNNIAELTAIGRGLEMVPSTDRGRPVTVYTDSAYSIGVLSKPWKPKKNVELIAAIRTTMQTFAQVRFVKVAGHSGIPENERTDVLATTAITRRTTERT